MNAPARRPAAPPGRARRLAALVTLLAALGALVLVGCTRERTPVERPTDPTQTLVGISMPTRALARWTEDAEGLAGLLRERGYRTSVHYADNRIEQQITQLENLMNQGADVLVVVPIDGAAVGTVLEQAHERGTAVIAYDRLITGTDAVDYYATFDNEQVGRLQGEHIRDSLGLGQGAGPFALELFGGSPDDNNAGYFLAGAWEVLAPYLASGQLVVPSGKVPSGPRDWRGIAIPEWSSAEAQSEMDNRLHSFYTRERVDAVLAPNDSLALGIARALEAAGYRPGEDWPVLTGQDADLPNVRAVLAGRQSMTVWKDTATLGLQVALMIDDLIAGRPVRVNDTTSYHNGVKAVPSYLLRPQPVVRDTVRSILVDSGRFSAVELGL